MAWNKYYIFVKSPKSAEIGPILAGLTLDHYQPIKEVPINSSNKPKTLFTGFYNGNLLIVHRDLPFHFFSDAQTEVEKKFIATFPDCEIAVLIENGTVSHFGYAIIHNQHKIRMKDGSNGEIFHDVGALLPEENKILTGKIFEDDELEDMKDDGMSDEEIDAAIKFEASWRVPNLLTKRYLGETIDQIDPDKLLLTMYGDSQ